MHDMLGVQHFDKLSAAWRQWVPRCSHAGCSRKPLANAVARRHSGITLADRWYCSPECFERDAREKVAEILSLRHTQEPPPALRMPLGLLLVSRGVLTADQLRVALDEQRITSTNLGEVVQQMGYASAEQVTAAVAAQWACPVFSMGTVPSDLPIHLPRLLMESYGMVPVHFTEVNRRLMVGFVARVQHHILYTIEHITCCTAVPCFITARDYWTCLAAPAFRARENETVFASVSNAAEIAQLTRNYVSQIGADRVRLGICRDYLWARIRSRRNEMDLLFRVH